MTAADNAATNHALMRYGSTDITQNFYCEIPFRLKPPTSGINYEHFGENFYHNINPDVCWRYQWFPKRTQNIF